MLLCVTDSRYKAVKLEIKAAVHVGPALAAVLGVQRPKYTIFGTTEDIVTALLHLSLPMSVLLSPNVVQPLQVRARWVEFAQPQETLAVNCRVILWGWKIRSPQICRVCRDNN